MSLNVQVDLQFQLTMQQQLRLTEVYNACTNHLSLRWYIVDNTEKYADAVLAKVEMDRKLSMIKAWEESEKSKAENKWVAMPARTMLLCLEEPSECLAKLCVTVFLLAISIAGLRRRCHPSCRGRTQRRRLWKQSFEHERSEYFPQNHKALNWSYAYVTLSNAHNKSHRWLWHQRYSAWWHWS